MKMSKKNEITKEELLGFFDYDRMRGVLIWKSHWYPNKQYLIGSEAGTFDHEGYRIVRLRGAGYRVHRLIWFIEYGTWPVQIDHIDGKRTNNRIENLRSANARINCQNKIHHRNGRLIGATFRRGKWDSQIELDGKRKHIGSFATEFAAHWAYMKRLVQHNKEG